MSMLLVAPKNNIRLIVIDGKIGMVLAVGRFWCLTNPKLTEADSDVMLAAKTSGLEKKMDILNVYEFVMKFYRREVGEATFDPKNKEMLFELEANEKNVGKFKDLMRWGELPALLDGPLALLAFMQMLGSLWYSILSIASMPECGPIETSHFDNDPPLGPGPQPSAN